MNDKSKIIKIYYCNWCNEFKNDSKEEVLDHVMEEHEEVARDWVADAFIEEEEISK